MPDKRELYNILSSKKLYTKSFDDFDKKYSDNQSIDGLYKTLSDRGYYNDNIDNFKSAYFGGVEKKNPIQNGSSGSDSGSGAQTSTQPLSASQNNDYNSWLNRNNIQDVTPTGQGIDYDYQAFFKDNNGKDIGEGHLTDTYKLPNHPTFSNESKQSKKGQEGGSWSKDENGRWVFNASQFNLSQHPTDELVEYFRNVEPDSKLILPDGTVAYDGSQQQDVAYNVNLPAANIDTGLDVNDPRAQAYLGNLQPQQTPQIPTVLTPSGADDYVRRNQDVIYQNAANIGASSQPQPQERSSNLADRISNFLYAPAFNKGFSDLVVKPLAGATDMADRLIDRAYTSLTGEKTPEWLRKGGIFDKISEFADKQYEDRDQPTNAVSEVAEGVVGTLPLIASMMTGTGEANILAQAPSTFGNLAKTFAVTKGLNSFKEATDEGKSLLESFEGSAKGAMEGIKEGLQLDAEMLVGGALGKSVSKALAEKGLLSGKTLDAVTHALGIGTVFGGTSAGEDLLAGRDIDVEEAAKQFGMGLAFEIVPVAKSIGADVRESRERRSIDDKIVQSAAVAKAAANLNGETAVRTLINLPEEAIRAINENVPETRDQLYERSIETGVRAFESKNSGDKRELYAQQLALKAQADVKLMAEDVKANYEEIINEINNSQELSPEQKESLTNKVNILNSAPPVEEVSFRVDDAAQRSQVDEAIRQFQQNNPGIEVDYLDDLPDSVVRTFDRAEKGLPTDPVALEEASDWMYSKYKQLTELKNSNERRLTTEQIENMQAQLGEDITFLENYKNSQRDGQETERRPIGTEAEPSEQTVNVSGQAETTAERAGEGSETITGEPASSTFETVAVKDSENPTRASDAYKSSYDRLTEGMTEEQINSDPELVRMRTRIEELNKGETENGTLQKQSTEPVSSRSTSGDSGEVGRRVPEPKKPTGEKEVRPKEVQESKKEIKPVKESDIPIGTGGEESFPVSGDSEVRVSVKESPDGENVYSVSTYRDGKIVEDKNGDTEIEFTEPSEVVKHINAKQRGSSLTGKQTVKASPQEESGELDTPAHLSIAGHEMSWETNNGKFRIIESNSKTPIGPEFDSKADLDKYWKANKSRITGIGMTDAIEQGKSGTQIMGMKKSKAGQRISPAMQTPSGAPKLLSDIIKNSADKLGATVIYGRPRARGAAGTYESSNALQTIRSSGDLDTYSHETGHFLDDTFDLLGSASQPVKNQLKWFYDRGGSNPPSGLSRAAKQEYLNREGIAEFVRAYIVNPAEAKRIAPELYDHFENTLPKEALDAIKEFSKDYLDFANSRAGDQITANIETVPDVDKKGLVSWLKTMSNDKTKLSFDWRDDLTSHIFNGLHAAEKAYDFASDINGVPKLLDVSRFEALARTFSGVNGKIDSMLKNGLVGVDGKTLKTINGENMTAKWLFEPLAAETVADVEAASHDVIRLLVATRTKEYASKFGRSDELSGIGGGVKEDLSVAETYLKEFQQMASQNPDYAAAIEEAASRYRIFADASLRYYRDSGRISSEQYNAIKNGNEMYVSLARVNELAPGEEPLAFIKSTPRAKIGAVREALKVSKGGTEKIANPYLSLFKNLNDMVTEGDRNTVMQEFIKPLQSDRRMGQGRTMQLAQIGRQVSKGEKNTIPVYIDGVEQRWQFDPDVYRALKSMDSMPMNAAMKVLSFPGKVVRFTVTTAPPFAARNLIRDTASRLLLSNNNSKLFDMFYDQNDAKMFEIYGGSQAGHYLTSRRSYYDMMKQSMQEVAKKSVILDASKIAELGKRYHNFLAKSENINRIAEFKAAYEKAKKSGLNDRDAGLYAAHQSRDLLDFAVAGHTIRVVNQIIPFTNAAIQGLRRAGKTINERPLEFAYKTALYTVLPTLFTRAMVHFTGDDDEYEELPYYQRDMYWNFKLPLLSDKWISIPKPFELGLFASGIDRGISAAMGKENSFEGFGSAVSGALIPVDETAIGGPFMPLIEVMTNKDLFRDSHIIPVWEENLKLDKREGAKYSSSLGQMLSDGFGFVGAEVDPRNIDHVVKGFASSYGDYAIRLSNLIGNNEYGRKTSVGEMSSFVKEKPIANAKDVLETYRLAERNGKGQSAPIKRLKKMIKSFYDANTIKERDRLSKEIYEYSKKIRKQMESLDKKE